MESNRVKSSGNGSGECGANMSTALSPLCTTKPSTNLRDSGTKRKASINCESERKRMKGAGEPTEVQEERVVKGTKRNSNTGQDPPCKKLRSGQHEANTSSASSTKPVKATQKEARADESDTSSRSNLVTAIKRKATTEELDSGSGSTRPAKLRKAESNTSNRITDPGTAARTRGRSSKSAKVTGKGAKPEEPDTSCCIIVSAGCRGNPFTTTRPTNSHEPDNDAEDIKDDFEKKYKQLDMLGKGGFGSVYAGIRKMDDRPVAIKHVQGQVERRQMIMNGTVRMVPTEVFMMLKVAGGPESETTSASVALLDWYDREDEVIIVMERPIPSVDLLDFIIQNKGPLEEDVAKNIMKQLVAAANEMHSKDILHRDLKLENILIETSSNGLRVRIIDFGCACIVGRNPYCTFSGTPAYAPPELYRTGMYEAGPTTVWQLGTMLCEMVNGFDRFNMIQFCCSGIQISNKLSKDCLDFLCQCLVQSPERRATLNQLQLHPWIR